MKCLHGQAKCCCVYRPYYVLYTCDPSILDCFTPSPRSILRQLVQPILPPLSRPPITPSLHPLSTLRTPHIHRRDDLVNLQCTAKHRELAEATMLAIRYAKATCPTCTSSLRRKIFHAELTLPIVRMQNGLNSRAFQKPAVGRPVIPARRSKTNSA